MKMQKQLVKTRNGLASLMAKLENTKAPARLNAFRQALKLVVLADAQARADGYRSVFTMLNKESIALAKKLKAKAKKR
jgi:hypothetical protein